MDARIVIRLVLEHAKHYHYDGSEFVHRELGYSISEADLVDLLNALCTLPTELSLKAARYNMPVRRKGGETADSIV